MECLPISKPEKVAEIDANDTLKSISHEWLMDGLVSISQFRETSCQKSHGFRVQKESEDLKVRLRAKALSLENLHKQFISEQSRL